jgi:hypothetical protein
MPAAAKAPATLHLPEHPSSQSHEHSQQYNAIVARRHALGGEEEVLLYVRLDGLPHGDAGYRAGHARDEAVALHAHARQVDEAAARGVWRYDEDVVVPRGQTAAAPGRRMGTSCRLGVGAMRRRRRRGRAVHGGACLRRPVCALKRASDVW